MRLSATLSLAAVFAAGTIAAHAGVVFSDGFNSGLTKITHDSLSHTGSAGNFTIQSPTNVDLLYSGGGYGSYCHGGGSCVDLGGTGGDPYGVLLTSGTSFAPGTYRLSFYVNATPGYPTSTFFIDFGNYDKSFTFNSGTTGNSVDVVNALVTVAAGDELSIGQSLLPTPTNPNAGPILSSLTVTSTPEPSSLALLGTGLLTGVGLLRRRKA